MMYINKSEAHREIPEPGEKLCFGKIAVPVISGECDYPHTFFTRKGETVYVPKGAVLSKLGSFFKIKIDEGVAKEYSCFGVHPDGLEFVRVGKKSILETIFGVLGFDSNKYRIVNF